MRRSNGEDGYVRCCSGIRFTRSRRRLRGCVSRCACGRDRYIQLLTGIDVGRISHAVGLLQGGYGGIEDHPNVIQRVPGAHIIDTPSMRLAAGYRCDPGSGLSRVRSICVPRLWGVGSFASGLGQRWQVQDDIRHKVLADQAVGLHQARHGGAARACQGIQVNPTRNHVLQPAPGRGAVCWHYLSLRDGGHR